MIFISLTIMFKAVSIRKSSLEYTTVSGCHRHDWGNTMILVAALSSVSNLVFKAFRVKALLGKYLKEKC